MKKVIAIGCLALITSACSNNNSAGEMMLKAHIFERKILPGNKLLVSYTYQKGPVLVNDSSVMDNKIILQDSVPVNLLVKK